MAEFLSCLLNMSMTGSIVILLVLAARLLLRRSPKIYSYALWAVVLFRLLCPVSVSASVSALDLFQPSVNERAPAVSTVSYPAIRYSPEPTAPDRSGQGVSTPAEDPSGQSDTSRETSGPTLWDILVFLWLAGVTGMAGYSVFQLVRLRRKLVGAVRYRERVYRSDYIDTPFVMGILRPRVYLPSTLSGTEREYILAHERHHIRRGDPIWKLLGFAALCLHWFNPLVWAAFLLAGSDMEMSCDEAVIRQLGDSIRADYSASLLRLATRKPILSGMPLAFGEGNTKGRIRNMARWKKPKVWASILCAAACIGILVACGVNPKEDTSPQVSGPTSVGVGSLNFTLPEGLTLEAAEEQASSQTVSDVLFLSDGVTVGGVKVWNAPDFSPEAGSAGESPNFDAWVQALGLPEAQPDASYSSMISGSLYADLEAEYFDDRDPGRMDVMHYFFIDSPLVYDIWFDRNTLPEDTDRLLLETVRLEAEATLPVTIGALPEGYAYTLASDGSVLFTDGTATVGGIAGYPIPEGVYDPNDTAFLWLEDVGIPDLEDPSLTVMGMITDFSGGCNMVVADDAASPTVQRYHRFTILGAFVYDLWMDDLLVDTQTQFAFADAVQYTAPNESVEQAVTEEDTAFQRAQAVTFGVQDSTVHIRSEYSSQGVPDKNATEDFWYDSDIGFLLTTEAAGGTVSGELYAYDRYFTNRDRDGIWTETEMPEVFRGPWLGEFYFVKSNVTYMGTVTDENGTCDKFRADVYYEDAEGYDPYYYVDFYYDPDGAFLQARLTVNQFRDNAFTVTESIVSLDAQQVAVEIEQEYQRAVG